MNGRVTLLAMVVCLPAAHAQFALFAVNGNTESPVPAVYSLGTVFADDAVSTQFRLRNVSSAPAPLTLLEVRGSGFTLANGPTLPLTLNAQASVNFAVAFHGSISVGASAALVSQGISVLLTVTVQPALPLPKPQLAVNLPRVQSGQQGSVTVNFDAAAQRSGSGALTMDFQPGPSGAMDPAIAFASGARTVAFTFATGDTQGRFASQSAALFQTGTTAGALVLTVQLGNASDQQTLTLAPTPVGLTAIQAARSAAGIEIRVTGFDNTRTVGALAFTFYDATGNPVVPGTIRLDAAATFSAFFHTSDAGGTFLLRAVFPVTGDSSRIASVETGLTNSAGMAATPRTPF